MSYTHWNVFFKDIYKVVIEVYARDTNKKISQKDLQDMTQPQRATRGGSSAAADGNQQTPAQSDQQAKYSKLYFVLRLYYQVKDLDETFSFTGEKDFLTSSMAKSKLRQRRGPSQPDFGLGAGIAGLKVGRKDIVAKDFKVMKKVYTAIQNHARRSTLL